jgi:hypothetical protein
MRVSMNLLSAGVSVGFQFSPVVSGTPEVGVSSHASGVPLVQRSGALLNGQPSLFFVTGASDQFAQVEIFPGVPFRVGAAYVLVGMSVSTAQGVVYCNVGVEVARVIPSGA